VNTSQRLVDQPGVEGALRRGELSPAQAAAISSAVAANPGEEERLVELASQVSLVELREECARVRAVADPDPEATNRRIHAARQLRQWVDGEGFWTLHAKGTPQAGAVFNTAIQPIIDQLFKGANRQGRREPVQAYAFDALIHLAQHATGSCTCTIGQDTATGDGDGDGDVGADAADVPTGGEKGGTDDEPVPGTFGGPVSASSTPGEPRIFAAGQGTAGLPCGVRPKATTNPRYLALLRVDVEALRRGHADDGELCEIAGVGPVPASVARAVLGEAIVKLVITNGVDVLNVTHLGRGPTAAQKAALLWVSPTCAVLRCPRTRMELDHREPWAETHHTRLDELDGLCEFHHDLKSRLGYALVQGTGKRAFVAPDDPRHPAYRTPPGDRPRRNTTTGGATARPPNRTTDRGRRTPARARQPDLFAEPQPP
jgi:Domain of unknown function (DUF222)